MPREENMEGDNKNSTTENEKDELVEKMNVLVVDDDSTCLSIIARLLKINNYQVLTAKNGKDALCTLETNANDVDLVVTDVHMPVMNGIVLQQYISKRFDGLPVVLMSANKKESLVLKGLDNGAEYFLKKPVDLEDLKNLWQFAALPKRNKNILLEQSSAGSSSDIPISLHEDVVVYTTLIDGKGKNKCNSKGPKRKYRRRTREGEVKDKIVWTEDLHIKFVNAINKLGIKNACPKNILDLMNEPELDRENIASHLQKYRSSLKKRACESSETKLVESNLANRATIQSTYASQVLNRLPKGKEEFDKYLLQMILSKRPEYAETSAQAIQRDPSTGSTSSNILTKKTTKNQEIQLVQEEISLNKKSLYSSSFPHEGVDKESELLAGVVDTNQNFSQKGSSSFGFKGYEKCLSMPTNHINEDQSSYVDLPLLPSSVISGSMPNRGSDFSMLGNTNNTSGNIVDMGSNFPYILGNTNSTSHTMLDRGSDFPVLGNSNANATSGTILDMGFNFSMLGNTNATSGTMLDPGYNCCLFGNSYATSNPRGTIDLTNSCFSQVNAQPSPHQGYQGIVATEEGSFESYNVPLYPLEQGYCEVADAEEGSSQVHNVTLYPLKQGGQNDVIVEKGLSQVQDDVNMEKGLSQVHNWPMYSLQQGEHESVTAEQGSSHIHNFPTYSLEQDDDENNIWRSFLSSNPFDGDH